MNPVNKILGKEKDTKTQEDEKTKITFKLITKTEIKIFQGKKEVGQIWSQYENNRTPYPHKNTQYCLNAIQICGFDKMSEVWGCGIYKGKKDCVVSFMPNTVWHDEQLKKYKEYLQQAIAIKDVKTVMSFKDWLQTGLSL